MFDKDLIASTIIGASIGLIAVACMSMPASHHDDGTFNTSAVVTLENGSQVDISKLPACATEDATNCYWDATRMGNGEGTSFVDYSGTAVYVATEGK